MLGLELAAQARARFFAGLERLRVGAEFHLDRLEGEAKAAIAQLAFEQVEGFAAPAEAAEHPHGLGPVAFGQQGAQGGDDRRGRMAPQGGGADQHGIAAADRLEQLVGRGEFTVDALHPHARAGDAAGDRIGDGGRVAIGAGEQQRHREAGPLLGFAPAAVLEQQTAPALGDGGAMARGDRADRQVIEPVEHRFHLAGHGGHQAVVEVAAVLFVAAAVGFGPVLTTQVGGEELATHQ